MQRSIKVISIVALVLALMVFVAGPGTRLGLWGFMTGLGLIFLPAKPLIPGVALSGVIYIVALLSLVGTVVAFVKVRGLLVFSLVATICVIVAAAVPYRMNAAIAANPFIHDITTDFVNPPQIVAAAELPRGNPPTYDGDELVERRDDGQTVAEAQQEAFPDIGPLSLSVGMEEAVAASLEAIAAMDMEVLAEEGVDGGSGETRRIEAVYTSAGFGFKDDFIVRLTPVESGGVRVDVRSKSRVGKSDLGDNAARVLEFLGRLKG